jgi:hypothetical protein
VSLDRPIFVIGAARSGTTLLGEVVSRHPDVSYWIEPKYIWRYRGAHSRSDVRVAEEATPQVAAYIRRRFERHAARDGRPRFAEKTPSNCLRIPFMNKIFQDGLFLNIERDGRDTTLSSHKKWTSPPAGGAIVRRATSFEIPLRDVPYYAADWLRDSLGRALFPKRGHIWGPLTPGIQEVRRRHGTLETCGIQWRDSVLAVREGLAGVSQERQLTVRYEALVSDPTGVLAQILHFLQLAPDADLMRYTAESVRSDSVGRWRQGDPELVARMMPLIGDAMAELGYETKD